MRPQSGPMLLAALLAALAGGLAGCTLAGVQVIPSVGVTSHRGDINGESLYVGAMFNPVPEVQEPRTFRSTPFSATPPVGRAAPAAAPGQYVPGSAYTGPLRPLAPSQSQPPAHVEHREPVTIETPWGEFVIYGLGGAFLAAVAAVMAMLRMQKKKAD